MTLRELLKDQGIDPNALLRQHVGQPDNGGGIAVTLADGKLDIHILVAVKKQKAAKPESKKKP